MDNEYNNMMPQGQKSSMGWIWWIIGIIIVLGLAWFFFGQPQDTQIIDDMSTPMTEETGDTSPTEYDENGLPLNGPLAPISDVQVVTMESFPVQVELLVSGDLPNGCTYLNSPAQVRRGNTFFVSITTRTEGEMCTEALVPYERRISLDTTGLPAGTYMVNVNGQELSFELAQQNQLNFEAGSEK